MTFAQARRKLPDRIETALLVLRGPERGDIDAMVHYRVGRESA